MTAPEGEPPTENADARPEGLGVGAFLWVLAVVVLNWLIYAVPAALALGAGFDVPLATGTTLALATVDPAWSTLVVATAVATLAVFALLGRMVQRVLHTDKSTAAPALWPPLIAAAAFVALALPMEWCAQDWMPDILSVGPLVALAAVVGVAVPVLLLWATGKVAAGLMGASLRSPFFAGIVAGLGTVALAPPAAAAASLFLMVQAVEAASELPPPTPVPVHVGDVSLLGGSQSSSPTNPDIDDCLRELQRMRAEIERKLVAKHRISYQDAEDTAGEAMVSVCVSEQLSSYTNIAAVYTTAANNKAVDMLRKRKGEVGIEPALCLPVYPDDWRLASEVVITDQAFGRLDGQTQDALRLWAHDEPHAVIAEHLGVTARKSRDLVGNGLKSMRRHVQKRCSYPEARAK